MALKYCLKNKAFSLLELIIAVAVLSIGIIASLQAVSFSARAAGLSCDYITAIFLLEDKLQELEFNASQNFIDLDKESTKSGVEDNKFSWGYAITQDDALKELNLYKLDFQISWERLNRDEKIGINTYLRK